MTVLHPFQGRKPAVPEDAFVAPGVCLIGQVRLGSKSSVWYNAVIRADTNTVTIGAGSNVQDNSVLHADPGAFRLVIGDNVTVGHGCIIHGCTVRDNVLVGMGSIILNGAVIGENSLIGAGSLITEGKVFPPGSVIMGRPAKVVREVGAQEAEMIRSAAAHYQENSRSHKRSLAPQEGE